MKQVALITSFLLIGLLIFSQKKTNHSADNGEENSEEMIGQETLSHL